MGYEALTALTEQQTYEEYHHLNVFSSFALPTASSLDLSIELVLCYIVK